jgi:hypothetical protein
MARRPHPRQVAPGACPEAETSDTEREEAAGLWYGRAVEREHGVDAGGVIEEIVV